MAVLQDININVHGQPSEKRLQTFLRLSQNENGRMINFRVLGPPLPSNCTATFSGTKPDGNVYSKTGTVTGNFVIIEEDIQMTAVAGVWDAKLDIINGTHNIMTALIRVVVDADVVDPDAIASDSQLQGLVAEAKYYAEHARTDAYGSPLTAPTKAQMTDHTRVYVYTGSEPNMVAGNWYHWNGSAWTSGGVYNAVAVQTDTTLSVAGKAADAKKTGDEISSLKEDLSAVEAEIASIEPGLSDNAKVALLNCFAHVAWTDEHGQTYYDTLESALYADSYPKITAVFNAGSNVIYTDTALNTLKQYLAVKYYETKDSAGTVVASTDYSLTGTLVEGSSTVSVSYDGLKTSCVINGVVDFYNIWEWSLADGDFTKLVASTDRNSNSLTGVTIRQDSTAQYRRNCSVTKGILPYTIRDTETLSQYYPIPVPATANKVTVSVTPDTQFTFLNIVKYDSATNKYNYYAGASNVNGWTQGVNEKTFTASDNLFLFFNVKYESAGSSYPTEPSNITVEFEEV